MGTEINKRITECRKKAGLSIKDVAERLGVNYTTYHRRETQGKRFSYEEVISIAEVIGADPDYIWKGKQTYDFTPLEPNILVAESPTRGVSPFGEPKAPVVVHPVNEFPLTSEEKAILLFYRSLTEGQRHEFIDKLEEIKN